jgi:hypothetical protein
MGSVARAGWVGWFGWLCCLAGHHMDPSSRVMNSMYIFIYLFIYIYIYICIYIYMTLLFIS